MSQGFVSLLAVGSKQAYWELADNLLARNWISDFVFELTVDLAAGTYATGWTGASFTLHTSGKSY